MNSVTRFVDRTADTLQRSRAQASGLHSLSPADREPMIVENNRKDAEPRNVADEDVILKGSLLAVDVAVAFGTVRRVAARCSASPASITTPTIVASGHPLYFRG